MILISGSHGYIGKKLAEKLKNINYLIKKYRVYKQADFSESGLTGAEIKAIKGIDTEKIIEQCDLKIGRDILSYEPKNEIDIIYHLAAQAGAIPSMDDPINDARQNILGTLKAIQLANRYGARLIYPASAAAKNPISPYGLSKKTAEEYIKMLCDDYVILRFPSIFGEKPVGVVDTFIREDMCIIYGDGSAVRDFVHVDDIVEALILAADWPKGEYDCGSGKRTTILEIANATGKDMTFEEKRKGEIHESILRNTTPLIDKTRQAWYPTIDVIDYIKEKCSGNL